MRPLPVRKGENSGVLALAFCKQYGMEGQEDRLQGHIDYSMKKVVNERGGGEGEK